VVSPSPSGRSTSQGVSAVNPFVAFYKIHGGMGHSWKKGTSAILVLSRIPDDTIHKYGTIKKLN
jgi:hypothetical protein